MKITYTPNPLNTIIELDENEKKILWYKIMMEELVESLFSVHYEVSHKKEGPDMERVKREVDPKYYLADDGNSPLEKRCDELLEHYLEELKSNHVGDCTCVACSCSKCHAEMLLGIDTIKGLGKHSAYKIGNAFSYKDEAGNWQERTMDEAIAHLENYDPKATWEGLEAHAPRWKEEARVALEWLKTYRDTHFTK